MASVQRLHLPGTMPAPAYAPRHQKTFEWQIIDQFCQKAKASPTFTPNSIAVSRLTDSEKLRTVVATDHTGTVLHGAAAMIKMTDGAGYLCFYKSSAELFGQHVRVKLSDTDENCLQVVSTKAAGSVQFTGDFVNLHNTSAYRSLEGHLFETLITKTFGLLDFERTKNVTVDVDDDDHARIAVLRDDVGFVFTDNVQFVSVEIDKKALIDFCDASKPTDGEVRPVDFGDPTVADALAEFDKSIAGYDRRDYLQFMGEKLNFKTYVHVAAEDSKVTGCLCLNKDTIFYLYATSEDVLKALLTRCIDKATGLDTVALCTRRNGTLHVWLEENASDKHKVLCTYRRLHTRCAPFKIVWSNVYAANIGWQLI